MMLMDEATAVLDASTSKAVTASILDIPELTKIAATHRLEPSILSRYDEIVVVKHGRICETGTFAESMDRKGQFFSLYNISQ